jgi:subtilisin family serine protease
MKRHRTTRRRSIRSLASRPTRFLVEHLEARTLLDGQLGQLWMGDTVPQVTGPTREVHESYWTLLGPNGENLWDTATGTDTASTLLMGVDNGIDSAIDRVTTNVTAGCATIAATGVPNVYAIRGTRAVLSDLANALAAEPFVRYIEPEQGVRAAAAPNDPKFDDATLYGLNGAKGINAPAAWDATPGTTYTTIAHLDTGADYNHPDLYLNVWINQAEIPAARRSNLLDVDYDNLITFYDLNDPRNQGTGKITDINADGRIDASDILAPSLPAGLGGWADGVSQDGDTAHLDDLIGWNFVANTNNPFDDNGHGTHTAGTIGAIGNNAVGVVGVDWKAQIMSLKVLDGAGNGSDANAAAALHYAADHGARVSNNSWGGGGPSATLLDALNYAGSKGHVVVAAAGNNNTNNDTTFYAPASYHLPNMIVVAATSNTGARASFSNFGPTTVDLGAPGVAIYSTLPNNTYGFMDGTSTAAAFVTGTAGLVLGQHPFWTYSQVVQQVVSATTPAASLSGITVKGGIINATAAVDHNAWSGYARDAQHTALTTVASQPLQTIRWQTPVDLNPQYSGGSVLLIHYGSPQVTEANTVIVPVKTGATSGFQVRGINGQNGQLKWTQNTDYVMPPHNWVPSYAPTLAPGNKLYFGGSGGTVYYINNPDAPGASTNGQLVFYGAANYNANKTPYDNNVFISTPITADKAGNIYFGFVVNGATPLNLVSGIARIDANGVGTYISAQAASGGDTSIGKVPLQAAPAVSLDGSTIYVSVRSNTTSNYGYLLALDSTTLQLKETSPGSGVKERVFLKDPRSGQANSAALLDDSSASPTIGPDGEVYYGVMGRPGNGSRGWTLHFSADLQQEKTPGPFGWDTTNAIVPSSMVASYTGTSKYLLFTKSNNYYGFDGGDGINKIAIYDPNDTMVEPHASSNGLLVMKEVMSIAGPTLDHEHPAPSVREWCINTAAVDPFTKSVLANSEDGKLYRWDLTTNSFTQVVTLTAGIGEAYTPVLIGKDGTVYAINNAILFAVGLNRAIIDDGDTGFSTTGNWVPMTGTPAGGGYQNDYRFSAAGSGADVATWTFPVTPGRYRVSATWLPHPNRAKDAPFTILDGTTALDTVRVNQELVPSDFTDDGVAWRNLGGPYDITGTSLVVRLTDSADEYVIADAIRIEYLGPIVSAPEIQVLDGTTNIADGSGSVDFGSGPAGIPVTKTFTVKNTGTASLTLTEPISVPVGFTVASSFGATTLAAGASTTFSVRFDAAAGTFAGAVSFANTDSDENPFNFSISASALAVMIVDDGATGFATAGSWTPLSGSAAGGGYQNDYMFSAAGSGTDTASWTFPVAPGRYRVSATWLPHSNRATNAPFTVLDGSTPLATTFVNQELAPNDFTDSGVGWRNLGGLYDIAGNSLVVRLTDAANEYVIADAVRIEYLGAAVPIPEIQVLDGITDIQDGAGSVGFGATPAGVTITKTFTVKNLGTANLNLTEPITVPAGFTLASSFGSVTVAPGGSTTFSVRFDATAGNYSGQVSFANGDGDESPFNFTISASASAVTIIDDGDSGFSTVGAWSSMSGAPAGGGYQTDYLFSSAGSGSNTASWTFIVAPGHYRVSATWLAHPNRATNAPFTVLDGTTPLATVSVIQETAPNDFSDAGVGWRDLGAGYDISGNTLVVRLSNAANEYVIADAIRIERV